MLSVFKAMLGKLSSVLDSWLSFQKIFVFLIKSVTELRPRLSKP